LAELKAEVEKLAAAGKFQAADRAARDYSGAFAAETAAARAELANWVKDKAAEQAQLDAQQAQLKEARAAEARKRLTYLFDSVALLILQQDLAGAKELLLRSAREEQYAAVSNELAAAEIFIRELGGSRDRILKSFERQKGQTVRFQLRGGALETGTVLEVADGRVLLQQNVTGGTITREVKPDELSLAEKQQRVGGVETPETLAIKGLLALREKDPNGAAALFAKAGALEKEGKGAGLAAALARMTNALEAEQRETAARNALREILQLAGLADLPLEEITAETVKEREYPAGEVAKIRAALEAFNSRHGETKTAKTQAALLEALAAVKIQPAGQMSVDLGDGVKLELVWIQPGEFLMGSPANEADRKEDEEQHKVKITKGFWMGKYEVTQAQWEQVMGNNPTAREHVGKDRPVNWVSWSDCHQFLRKLNELVQNKKIKIKQGEFRLPTEAEWEYACRAGTKTRFCSGDKEDDLDAMGWCKENSGATTHAVGQKKANAWGLFDMHGNLGEWCEDYYANYPGGEVKDPTGPATSEAGLVFRGGNWLENHHTCRSAKRDFGAHKSCRVTIGLRVVLR
jgi:formylglycine-generating enzyme required for sulfatase activity